MGSLHRFPAVRIARPKPVVQGDPLEAIDPVRTRELERLVQTEIRKIDELCDLIDDRREEMRKLGAESIAIELCALSEGGRLLAVRDELLDAVASGRSAHLTPSGLDLIHRVDRLLAEADRARAHGQKPVPFSVRQMGQAPSTSVGEFLWAPVIVFGLAVLGAVAYAVITGGRTGKENNPVNRAPWFASRTKTHEHG